MFKTIFKTNMVKMEDVVRAFDKIGLERIPTGDRVPRQVVMDALSTNPEGKSAFMSGRAEFVPLDYQEWKNGYDSVQVIDYELREPIRTTLDPVGIVTEIVYRKTSFLVKEALERELEIDFIKNARLKGVDSDYARRCIVELAELRGANPARLLSEYTESFEKTWVHILNGERPPLPTQKRKPEAEPRSVYYNVPVKVRT